MIPETFIQQSADIIGNTNNGLSTAQICRLCSAYAVDFGVDIPYSKVPQMGTYSNKRTLLFDNLVKFSPEQQYKIIRELCENDAIKENPEVKKLKATLIARYNQFANNDAVQNIEYVEETIHWLDDYRDTKKIYDEALLKLNNNVFDRNTLDDFRLSLETLLRTILGNGKSLENQKSDLGLFFKSKAASPEFANLFNAVVDIYSKYQNNHVKHQNKVIAEEINFIVGLTSLLMQHIIRLSRI